MGLLNDTLGGPTTFGGGTVVKHRTVVPELRSPQALKPRNTSPQIHELRKSKNPRQVFAGPEIQKPACPRTLDDSTKAKPGTHGLRKMRISKISQSSKSKSDSPGKAANCTNPTSQRNVRDRKSMVSVERQINELRNRQNARSWEISNSTIRQLPTSPVLRPPHPHN